MKRSIEGVGIGGVIADRFGRRSEEELHAPKGGRP